MVETTAWSAAETFAVGAPEANDVPIRFMGSNDVATSDAFDAAQRAWLAAQNFSGNAKRSVLVPNAKGEIASVAFGIGNGWQGEPSGPSELLAGLLSSGLPAGTYRIASDLARPDLAALAWALGGYSFSRYRKKEANGARAKLRLEAESAERVINTAEAVWLGRDLINTPASDMAPADLEAAARLLADRHGADISVIVGDDLLAKNFPLIHAVGRASPRQPRLIDMTWGPVGAPKITLVGKGISFDTGGLDIKPSSAMLLMKKDMGGAATALALAHMIMGQRLNCRLRVLIPTAENSVGGDAFRPGDILNSRLGLSVEIGNTDAEGRLVLADALARASEDSPDLLIDFATLTGAARVALGPDLAPLYTDDEALAADILAASAETGDPVWRMPLWDPYISYLQSPVADLVNSGGGGMAGSISAAIFLKQFVSAKSWAHFDIWAWRKAKYGRPDGAAACGLRAVWAMLEKRYSAG